MSSLVSKIASLGVGEVLSGVGTLAKDLRAALTGELSQEQKAAIEQQLIDLERKAVDAGRRLFEVQGQVVIAEARGESWLQRNWRPVLMISIVAIVVNNYLVAPYGRLFFPGAVQVLELPESLWGLMKIGVGGYVLGRTGEKVARTWKENKE